MSEKKNVLDIYDDILSGRVKLAQKTEESEQPAGDAAGLLCSYLAMQRTMVVVFQHSHWKCKAVTFYGQHLLFERIYNAVNTLTDATAEKLIGVFGNDALEHNNQLEIMSGIYKKYNGEHHLANSINISKDFLKMAEDIYNRLKEMGDITLGIDDMIMSQCSDVEGYLYLLQQASVGIKSEIESETNE